MTDNSDPVKAGRDSDSIAILQDSRAGASNERTESCLKLSALASMSSSMQVSSQVTVRQAEAIKQLKEGRCE